MRFLVWATMAVAVLWGGYWVVGRSGVEAGAEALASHLRDEGAEVSWDSLATRGFPSRFDTSVEGLRYGAGSVTWQSPLVQVLALSYRPNNVIVVLPGEQRLTTGLLDWTIDSADLRASATVAPSPALPLRELTVEGDELRATSDLIGIEAFYMLAALRRAEGPATYDAYLQLSDGRIGDLPVSAAFADMTAELSEEITRDTLATGVQPRAVNVKSLRLSVGAVQMTGSGDLTFGATGRPSGQLDLTVENWPAALDLLVENGVLSDRQARLARALAGGATDVTLPITLRDGEALLFGQLPLRF